MRLEGRTAIVTGASRGMGKHFARALVREGAKVALLARASSALDGVAAELGDAALAVPCDIGDPQAVRDAFAAVEARFRGLDFLINNAGMSTLGTTETFSDEDIMAHVRVNFLGAVYTCRSALPLLRRSSRPHIVNVSSESVKQPFARLSMYTSTKAALEDYTRALRKELREDGIRVTTLRSGHVAGSEMGRNWTDPDQAKTFIDQCVVWGNAAETGSAASPEAMADTLIELLSLPSELNVDLLELRPLLP